MLFDIRIAALEDLAEQRVRLAVSLLLADRLRAKVNPWDGTRCHLLVADADDAYGRQALRLALRRGTLVIALGYRAENLGLKPTSPLSTAQMLSREMRTLLEGLALQDEPAPQESSVPQAKIGVGPKVRPVICRLASSQMRGKPYNINCNGRIVLLCPDSGRAYASSHSDLLAVVEGISDSTIERPAPVSVAKMVSCSVEAFLLRAADRAGDRLPNFPQGRFRLEVWPDLGSVPLLLDALKIAKLLTQKAMTPQELRQTKVYDIDPGALNACLWGLAAANLLVDAVPAVQKTTIVSPTRTTVMPAPRKRVKPGIWSSIARRFGLSSC